MTRARDNADLGDSYGTVGSGVVFPAGHVLQVVYGICETEMIRTIVDPIDLGLSAAITPTSSSNHILCTWVIQTELTGATGYSVKLLRDDGAGYDEIFASASGYDVYKGTGGDNFRLHNTWTHKDTPGVTTACTYKIEVANYATTAIHYQDADNRSSLILMEIVA